MPIFADKALFQDCITGFFLAMRQDSQIGPRVQATGLVVRFSYSHPDTFVIVDCRRTPIGVEWDKDPALAAVERSKIYIEMSMETARGHESWPGTVKRAVNSLPGVTAADDRLPRRLLTPLAEGPTAGTAPDLPAILMEFYALCHLDEQDRPKADRLRSLGLDDAAQKRHAQG